MVQDKVVEELGLVMRLRRNGIVVLVPRFGIEGNIFLIDNDARKAGACGHTPVLVPCPAVTGCVCCVFSTGCKSEDVFTYDADAQTITRKANTSQVLKVFDAVRVQISVETLRNRTQKLVYRLVKPFALPLGPGNVAVTPKATSPPGNEAEAPAVAPAKSAKAGKATKAAKSTASKAKKRAATDAASSATRKPSKATKRRRKKR